MFTAMISRRYLVVALFGLGVVLGGGWIVHQLRRDEVPASVARAPEQAVSEAAGPAPETQAPETPARAPSTPAEVAGGADSGAEPGAAPAEPSPGRSPDAAVAPARDAARPAPAPDAPQVARTEQAEPTPPSATAAIPAPAKAQVQEAQSSAGALSAPAEPAAPAAGRTAPATAAPAAPGPEPSVVFRAPGPASPADAPAAPAAGGTASEEIAAPRPAAGEPAAEAASESEAAAAPDPAASGAAVAERSSSSAPAPQPKTQKQVGLAVPPAPEAQEPGPAATPPAEARPPAAVVPAMPEEPAAKEAAQPRHAARPADEPRSARARVAETIKRAITALFGGAADEPVPDEGTGQAGVEAPEATPAAPPPGRARELAEVEPSAPPSFDVVRIEPGGRAVIAGRAAPGAEVELRTGERVIDRVRADRRGEWVAVPPEPLTPGDQELSVAARIANRPAVESEEVLVVAVPEPPPPQPAPRAGAEPPPPQPAQVAAAEPASQPLAVALPRVGTGAGRILQAPGRISGDGTLALNMLDYDEGGRTRLRGEAAPGAPIRIYVDNEPAGGVVVEPSGRWTTVLERTLAPGDYMLRLDQLGASGKPVARLETPFTRVSQPPAEGEVQVDYVIVQPGNSLWRIARRVFGQGIRYVHIYEANQAQIRDPDMIYPGQVFEIPPGLLGQAG